MFMFGQYLKLFMFSFKLQAIAQFLGLTLFVKFTKAF